MSRRSLATAVAILSLACSGSDLLLPGGAAPKAALMLISGDEQTGTVGKPLAEVPTIRVVDTSGSGIAGIDVTFEVIEGGGQISGADATTDDNGIAAVERWTLGDDPGTNRLRATAQGSEIAGNPITFSATAIGVPAPPAPPEESRLVFLVQPSDATEGDEIEPAIAVAVVDAQDNVVRDRTGKVRLDLLGGRNRPRLHGDTEQTLQDGVATFRGLSIGRDAQDYRFRASLSGLTSVESSTFDIIDD